MDQPYRELGRARTCLKTSPNVAGTGVTHWTYMRLHTQNRKNCVQCTLCPLGPAHNSRTCDLLRQSNEASHTPEHMRAYQAEYGADLHNEQI